MFTLSSSVERVGDSVGGQLQQLASVAEPPYPFGSKPTRLRAGSQLVVGHPGPQMVDGVETAIVGMTIDRLQIRCPVDSANLARAALSSLRGPHPASAASSSDLPDAEESSTVASGPPVHHGCTRTRRRSAVRGGQAPPERQSEGHDPQRRLSRSPPEPH